MIGENHIKYERRGVLVVGVALVLSILLFAVIGILNTQDTTPLTYSRCGILSCRSPREIYSILGVIGSIGILNLLLLSILIQRGDDDGGE